MTELEQYIISIIENDSKYVSRAFKYNYTIHDYILSLRAIEIFNHMGIRENIFNNELSKLEFHLKFNLVIDKNYVKQQYAKFLIHMHHMTLKSNYEFDVSNIVRIHRAEYSWNSRNNITNPDKKFYLL